MKFKKQLGCVAAAVVAVAVVLTAIRAKGVSEGWQAMPLVRPDILAAGNIGGEGCQAPQTIAIDAVNGNFILFGADVGGIYRSTNGGKQFEPANIGFSAVGAAGFAIDPRNSQRALAVGDNTGNEWYRYGGIYLTTDQGATWKQTLEKLNKANGNDKGREQIAFDPRSYDETLQYCKVAYWAQEFNQGEKGGRLYKTEDGGTTWSLAADGKAYGGGEGSSILKVHPASGAVYIANNNGFYKSTDGGKTFQRTKTGKFTSLDVVPSQPDVVYASTMMELMVSKDAGEKFETISHQGTDSFYHVKVSPANPQFMVNHNRPGDKARYVSQDGGRSWVRSEDDFAMSFIPPDILYNERSMLTVWHPTDANVAWAIGDGDIMTSTRDGGKTFRWDNNGYNGIMIGGLMNFNAQNPDVLYFGSQDYNGALTKDGGQTWEFINLSISNKKAKRGDDSDAWGWVYGGYAASDQIMFGGNKAYTEDSYNLWITFDGGKTSEQKVTGLQGAQVSYGDPNDPDVLFCWNQRSADGGKTWTKMNSCDGVFISSASGKRELYGRNGNDIVRSLDKGKSWQKVATLPTKVRDVAYDHKRQRIYAAAEDQKLYVLDAPNFNPVSIHDKLPRDQHNDKFMTSSVAVDPVDPNVVYAAACGTGLFFQRNNAVARSLDGGETWERLTCNPKYGPNGGQMASAIRVHPRNRYLYVGTCCYGMWRFSPPK